MEEKLKTPHPNNAGVKNSQYDDEIFKIPSDKVKLPSGGELYGASIPPILDVEYVTAKDEDILYSSELMNTGSIFNTLVREKIRTHGVNVDELLVGDFNEILLFLRKSAYGQIYSTKTIDPDTNKVVTQPIDLDYLSRKGIGAQYNEMGEFDFVLPLINKRITFKLCTVGMMDYINNRAEQQANKVNGVKPYIKTRLETQITSVEGKRDKIYISKFVDVIPPGDRLAFMQYMESIEPGVELSYTFKSSIKGNDYQDKIILGLDFFYPQNV